ncbi:sugar transferase [Streptomyces flavofungini]|uniref:sugar transferase n=1 Tax=Streptomyces flavofungini TaxID=68200 RepID=UPI0025B181F9|nr:sugar transferase [Streptomyces flavofungini]WJV47496.1 sugar transferase [Streptomyces flavofungini]
MSAERTVTSSSGHPRQHERHRTGPLVVAPRGAPAGRAGRRGGQPVHRGRRALAPLTADALAAVTAALLLPDPYRSPVLLALLLTGVLALNAQGRLYEDTLAPSLLDELPALAWRIALAWCAVATVTPALTPALAPVLPPMTSFTPLPPATLLTAAALHGVLGAGGRALAHWHRRSAAARRPRPVLVLGHGGQARSVAAALLRRPRCGVRPVGVVGEAREAGETGETRGTGGTGGTGDGEYKEYAVAYETERGAGADGGHGGGPERHVGVAPELPLLSSDDELHRAVIQNDVRAVLLLSGRAPADDARVTALRGLGCELWEVDPHGPAVLAPRDRARPLFVAGFRCRPLVAADRPRPSAGKRALDIVVSGTLLLLTGPLLLACALVLRATEGPGVVFRQERVGKDGRLFTLLKFRTHRPADPQESATRWSVADEHRMSPFCRFLRGTSLDELPQLWNVLRGDMSLVGPRPERPFFVDRFSLRHPQYAYRHRMQTGITGLAQIHGLRGDTSIEDRCRYDNAYIDSWSLWQDLCILLRTVGCLLRRTGS